MNALLLTGATGFIGMEVLARLVERGDRQVYALVRASDDTEADARLRSILKQTTGSGSEERVVAIRGDVEEPGLGLSDERQDRLAEEVSDILHVAASVSFTLPLEEARAINVEGTRHALEFAERCRERGSFRRFSHVSTAYVAGTHTGEFREEDFDVGQEFRNTYEQTKFEAEALVRSYADRLPLQVFRPSIIVGDSATGWTSSFNVIYAPLKAFQRHTILAVPARRRSPVDVVPVDFVADAVVELVENPEEGIPRTYHLVAGRNATTVGRLIELSAERFGKRRPPLIPAPVYMRLIRPLIHAVSSPRRREALRRNTVFVPYFSLRLRYDNEQTRQRLARAGIAVPRVEDYFHRLVDFAVRAKWGKVEVPRAAARRELAAVS